MIVNAKVEITWDSAPKAFAYQSEKKVSRTLKELTGAADVEILDWNVFDEDDVKINHMIKSKLNIIQSTELRK